MESAISDSTSRISRVSATKEESIQGKTTGNCQCDFLNGKSSNKRRLESEDATQSSETAKLVANSSEFNQVKGVVAQVDPEVKLCATSLNEAEDGQEEDNHTSKDYYFDSYSHHAIHEEMLKDEVRTKTYEMAIKQNPHLFEGKIVLDVGCGTGVLSMFAAQAGAKHVYAVDCSSIIDQARAIIKLNNFEYQITLIHGKIEEIELPVVSVDVVLSEWLGYCLLYESMLDSVLFARDKWLVPNGIVFPDKAVLYIAAIEDGLIKRERIDFWQDVYGFNMQPLKEIAIKEPVVDIVDAKAIVTDSVPVLTLDILTCTKEDLAFKNPFKLKAQRNDYIHGLITYFECAFTQVHKPIGFSTAPFARYTHWKQTIFYLRETLTICSRETIEGEFLCRPNQKNKRDLDIIISLSFKGRYCQFEETDMEYRLR